MFVVIAVSITNILASAHFLEFIKPKRFDVSTHCYMCIGFWVGVALSFTQYSIGQWWVCGLVSSIASQLVDSVLERLEK